MSHGGSSFRQIQVKETLGGSRTTTSGGARHGLTFSWKDTLRRVGRFADVLIADAQETDVDRVVGLRKKGVYEIP